jgi:hypothetical protein
MRQSLYGHQIIMWSFCIQAFHKVISEGDSNFILYALCSML